MNPKIAHRPPAFLAFLVCTQAFHGNISSQSAAEEINSQNYRQNFSSLKPKEIGLSPLLRPKVTLNTNSIFFHLCDDFKCSEGSSSVTNFSKRLTLVAGVAQVACNPIE